MIPDGATLQLGIGGIPTAVIKHLMDHKDLGIHTEMLSDGLMELMLAGWRRDGKTIHLKAVIALQQVPGICMISWMTILMIEGQPVQYVNNPAVIARNTKQVAINAALEVDLTGQICAESMEQISTKAPAASWFHQGHMIRRGQGHHRLCSTARGEVSGLCPP